MVDVGVEIASKFADLYAINSMYRKLVAVGNMRGNDYYVDMWIDLQKSAYSAYVDLECPEGTDSEGYSAVCAHYQIRSTYPTHKLNEAFFIGTSNWMDLTEWGVVDAWPEVDVSGRLIDLIPKINEKIASVNLFMALRHLNSGLVDVAGARPRIMTRYLA